MVHAYECLGKFFVLDIESGSVFEVDELSYLLVRQRISPKGFPKGVFSRFDDAEIDEANKELDALTAEGVLFSSHAHFLKESKGIIKAMCLNITHDCNLRCTYCFADGGSYKGERAHMSLETAQKAVNFLIKNSGNRKNLEIDFFGGEPVLNFDTIKKTVQYAKDEGKKFNKNFRFTVTTNALLLNEEHIQFFNKEMYNVVISIDGRKEIHDSVRKTQNGSPSFDVILKNALCFKNLRDGQYYVRGTFTANNLDFSSDVLFLNDLGFDQISIEPVVLESDNPLAINQQHLDKIYTEYEKLAKEYLKRRKEGKSFNFFHFNVDLDNSICETKRLKGCGAGCEYVAVAPDGSVYPCHQFDGEGDYKMGTVTDGSLDKSIIEQFDKASVLAKDDCEACFAKYHCSGGCNAANIKYAGGINNVCKVSCELFKRRLELAIAVNALEKSDI